ncbi:MAG: exodeoxyribonuclease VII large subunit [Ignavibacteria bacterium]|nr:exodeoxyribonuclease VII large subunit [Ignavibacteria bacterium]MBT8390175.1 exodeoxyribonuclease VII large subunit [Ignavibacteria bacterium]NNL20354.1 exodeoxyribonuclease VII large subunit [Ignavibacteriaceae bacterium]
MAKEIQILSVSELTKEIQKTLEESFSQVSVIGEISNFKQHISGHWYFNLKDADAVINCTMWKGFNQYVFFTPQDGMKVVLNGKITVYPPRGNYQIDVRSMKPAGVGELQEAFERLKKKLEAEGLFDDARKRPIPTFPYKIGIVTAIDGAAFKDMISVARRRYPLIELVIAPSKVQGSGAAESIVDSIKLLNDYGKVDVIISGRGGGSIEDLWAFNEEIVARAIYKSKVPIISAVGHEVDFTIADYVADLRAPTPSVAMEVTTPSKEEIFGFIDDNLYTSSQVISDMIEQKKYSVVISINSYGFKNLLDVIIGKNQTVDQIISKIFQSVDKLIFTTKNSINLFSSTIKSYDIQNILKRGFVLVEQNSKFVGSASEFIKDKNAKLKFYDGDIEINK